MRYLKLFSIYFQDAFAQRARSLVWFLISLIGPIIMIIFWRGASYQHTSWSFSTISTYYFLLIIASAFLMTHPEEWIAEEHIKGGNLAQFLLRPFSYFFSNFMSELPWRIIQGLFGLIVVVICYYLFGKLINISFSFQNLIISIIISILGYLLGFVYKMNLALLAFWFTEISGILQVSDILIFTFGGYIAPIFLFPDTLAHIATILPFSYIIYFPVVAFQGKVDVLNFFRIVGIQVAWITLFSVSYKILWRKGLKKFTATGQ